MTKIILCMTIAIALSTTASAQSAPSPANANSKLTWTAPTTYADGTVLPAGSLSSYTVGVFQISSTTTPNTGQASLAVLDVSASTLTVQIKTVLAVGTLPDGQYRFATRCTDLNGNISDWSNLVELDIKSKKPSPPGNLQFTK